MGILSELGCAEYAANFEKEGVDGGIFMILDESSLTELGVDSSLKRKKILRWMHDHQ